MQVFAESYLSPQLEIPDSGFGEILACRIRDPADFCCRIRNPRLWNTEYTSQGIRNPTNDWNPQSNFLWLRIRNPWRGIRNPRLSWIPLHVAIPQFLLKLRFDSTISLAYVNKPDWVFNDQNRFSKRKELTFSSFYLLGWCKGGGDTNLPLSSLLGPVFRRPISANPGLNFNPGFSFFVQNHFSG